MTFKQLSIPTLALCFSCAAFAQSKPVGLEGASQAPFACNLTAFNPSERVRWRKSLEEVVAAVLETRELADGYALRIDTARQSPPAVAAWVELERRCCPFFDFQIDVRGEDGSQWLSLKGRDGVKQFIEMDFTLLRDKLPKHDAAN